MRKEKVRTKDSTRIKILIVVTFVGLVIIIYCNRGKSRAKASASWPSVKGEIISSQMAEPIFHLGRRSGTIKRPHYYIFKAHYKYEVDGKVYNSERVSFLSKYISKEKRIDIESKYAQGKSIDVFYNPTTSGEAVLITGVNEYNENPYSLLGIILFCIGTFILIIYGLDYLTETRRT